MELSASEAAYSLRDDNRYQLSLNYALIHSLHLYSAFPKH